MALKLKGKKLGMTHLFDEKGNALVCTVIEVEPNVIVQLKTKETDGYTAIQTAYSKVETKDPRTIEKRVSKPLRGHYAKSDVQPRRHLQESRVENPEEYSIGQEFGVEIFKDIAYLDVTGTSIGKGYQGAMKLHNFHGMNASHGNGPTHRHLGSSGSLTPSRCFKGGKRASHMGNRTVTTQNVKVVEIDEKENLIVVKGAIPGPRNGIVTLSQAVKKEVKA